MRQVLAAAPIIAAVRREEDLDRALASPVAVVFFLYGDINTVEDAVARVQERGKRAFLHVDLVQGFGTDRAAMRFIARRVRPAGILTTKSQVVRYAHDEGLACIQRFFIVDSQSLATAVQHARAAPVAAVEVMPASLPAWALQRLVREVPVPVIAGGLVSTPEEAQRALRAGAAGVSVGNPALWSLDLAAGPGGGP